MDYLEISIKEIDEKTQELYKLIKKDKYEYDLVIFIAKGSYYIGKKLSEYNKTPLLEIFATRKGNKIKKILKPFLKFIPKTILIKLREKEMKGNYHEKNNDREVSFNKNIYLKYADCKNILLVDDSVDSGNSVILTKTAISKYFKKANIKVAVFNIMSKSSIKVDYTLYHDVMICGPWSNDSKYNNTYRDMYNQWKLVQEQEEK